VERRLVGQLTAQVHELLADLLRPGDVAIDATAGNGHDTLFLARQVGSTGCVHAFDVQQAALDETRKRLDSAGLSGVILHRECHSRMSQFVPASLHRAIAAVTFNLGYLPGGEKSLITRPETSLRAIQAAVELVRPGGMVTVLCYRGHPGGRAETEAIEQLTNTWSEGASDSPISLTWSAADEPDDLGPRLLVIRKSGAELRREPS
jgi:predicted methyltransferase